MGRLLAPFAVPVLVYDQNAFLVGGGRRVLEQEFEAALVDLFVVPPGFREEPLQALCFLTLRSCERLGVGKSGQSLVALGGKQQSLQVAPKAIALGAGTRNRSSKRWRSPPEDPGRGLQVAFWSWRHLLCSPLEHGPDHTSTNYR